MESTPYLYICNRWGVILCFLCTTQHHNHPNVNILKESNIPIGRVQIINTSEDILRLLCTSPIHIVMHRPYQMQASHKIKASPWGKRKAEAQFMYK